MLDLKWDRICVLLVDDNAFMRKLLATTLGAMGIKRIISEPDSAGAIERLKLSRTDPVEAGLGEVDLILSDYMMPGVNGNLFLRWVRTGEGAPDRFVPFIMVSGVASKNIVGEARDTGVSGILAKPFSGKTLAEHILLVVNKNHHFVLAAGYFGPCRRHTTIVVAEERRTTTPEQIQTVKPDSDIRTLRDDVRALYFYPDNRIRKKLGHSGSREAVEFDPQVIRAIETRIQDLVGDYADWVDKHIESMSRSLAKLKPTKAPTKTDRKHIANINRIAHELHGQGSTFDYPLITDFGQSLFNATENTEMKITENTRKLIEAHINAIRTVFKNRIQGTGGEVGAQLLSEIARAVKKYT
jgi:CheY-like chemotaxis protein